jgi:hypothetical protein
MAPTLPAAEPTTTVAGDTWRWTRIFSTYPISEGWSLSYAINGPEALAWNASWVTNDGSRFTVTIPATSTALPPGRYEWSAVLTGSGSYSGQRYIGAQGVLLVAADPATQDDGDRLTHAAKMVTALEAAIEGRATNDVLAYSLPNGRSVQMADPAELLRWLTFYKGIQWREEHPGQALPGYAVRFGVTT